MIGSITTDAIAFYCLPLTTIALLYGTLLYLITSCVCPYTDKNNLSIFPSGLRLEDYFPYSVSAERFN